MSFVAFLFVGLVSGFLAGKIVAGRGFGAAGDIVIGIIGAFIGGFFSNEVVGEASGMMGSIGISTLWAVILLFLGKLILGKKAIESR